MTVLRSLLRQSPDPPPNGPFFHRPASSLTAAGVLVDERTALTLSTVYACVRLVSEAIATLPVDVFRTSGRDRLPLETLPAFLVTPHPEMSRPEWLGRIMTSLLLQGNAYVRVVAVDRAGWPTVALPLHPDQVRVRRRDGQLTYTVVGNTTPLLAWPLGEMVHIRGVVLAGADEGLSPVAYARQSMGLAIAAERFGASLFGSGGNPSGVLKVVKNLDRHQAEMLKDDWERAHSGPSRRPAVLSGGAEWKPVSLTPEDGQFLQTRQFETAEVARWFAVPGLLIGDMSAQSSWAASIEALGIMFARYTLGPWLVRLEHALTSMLPRPQDVRFNVGGLLRADLLTRYRAHAIAIQWGWHSVNDTRALEDEAPVEGGDEYLRPLNMGTLADPGTDPAAATGGDQGVGVGEPALASADPALVAAVAASDREAALRAENARLRAEAARARASREWKIVRDELGRAVEMVGAPKNGQGG